MKWTILGGRVVNNSSSKLVVAYDHPTEEKSWGHSYVESGKATPRTWDVDGFRPVASDITVVYKPMILSNQSHKGWWKIRNGHTAIVENGTSSSELVFTIVPDGGFGQVTGYMDPVKKNDADFGWKGAGQEVFPLPD